MASIDLAYGATFSAALMAAAACALLVAAERFGIAPTPAAHAMKHVARTADNRVPPPRGRRL